MQLQLSDADEAFRSEVRAFLDKTLTDELRHKQRLTPSQGLSDREVERVWHTALNEKGWVGVFWPKEFGGPGWTPVQRYIFESECAKAGAPVLAPMTVRMVASVLIGYGSPEQRAYYLPRILSGEDYWCQGYSEPEAGSDLASLKTSAVLDGDAYVINGTKIWTTHAHHANRMFALVRTSTGARKQEGISFILIDMDLPGVTVRPIVMLGGDHHFNQVYFDNVRVPKGNLIGEEGQGWKYAKYLLEFERGADFASARLRTEIRHLIATMAPTADHPAGPLGDPAIAARFFALEVDLDVLEMMELDQLSILQNGGSPGVMASYVRVRAAEIDQQMTKLAVDILQNDALYWSAAHPFFELNTVSTRHPEGLAATPRYLNVRASTIAAGTSEIQRDIIAKSLFG